MVCYFNRLFHFTKPLRLKALLQKHFHPSVFMQMMLMLDYVAQKITQRKVIHKKVLSMERHLGTIYVYIPILLPIEKSIIINWSRVVFDEQIRTFFMLSSSSHRTII